MVGTKATRFLLCFFPSLRAAPARYERCIRWRSHTDSRSRNHGKLEADGAAGAWHHLDRRMCLVVLRALGQGSGLERDERQSKRVYPLSKLLIAARAAVRSTT